MANVIILQIKHQCQLIQHHIPEIRAKSGISCVQTCVFVLPKLSVALIDLFMLEEFFSGKDTGPKQWLKDQLHDGIALV